MRPHQNRARALRATRIALYVWDFPSARVWLVLCSRIQGNIIMWRTPYFYLMRSHVINVYRQYSVNTTHCHLFTFTNDFTKMQLVFQVEHVLKY